jgi:hypothetical protein
MSALTVTASGKVSFISLRGWLYHKPCNRFK